MDDVELVIEKLVPGGMGLARLEGRVAFVPHTAPGDRIRGRIEADRRHHLMVRCQEILVPGPDTVDPGCGVNGRCGGCQLRRIAPETQDAIKTGFVREGLERIARLDSAGLVVQPLLPAQQRDGYRRRATFQVGWNGSEVLLGFFAHGSHDIVDLTDCPVLDPRLSALFGPLRCFIARLQARAALNAIEVVAGDAGVGMVFCLLRPCPNADKEAMRTFATEIGVDQLWLRLGRAAPRPLVTRRTLSYELDGLSIAFGPEDFVQGHALQNRLLVAETLRLSGRLSGRGQVAWDLFCGIGNFTLPLARSFAAVLGADLMAGSLHRAGKNVQKNGLAPVTFRRIDLFREEGVSLLPWQDPVDLVLLDPPRNGAETLCRHLATHGKAGRVVYVSCDPATLARDVAILVGGGFVLETVQPVDLFPQTRHVETIASFTRNGREKKD
ncbi:MAG: hypothetical protein HQL91_02885 [Magnetococcales bacterium]|nr:hypothetical protein [Magnetococcales bacterium]